MKQAVAWALATGLLALAATPVRAGQVYGSLKQSGRTLGHAVPMRIECGAGAVRSFTTDRYGSYRVYVPLSGRCTLTAEFRGRTYEAKVYAYDRPARYDFELVWRDGAGVVEQR